MIWRGRLIRAALILFSPLILVGFAVWYIGYALFRLAGWIVNGDSR